MCVCVCVYYVHTCVSLQGFDVASSDVEYVVSIMDQLTQELIEEGIVILVEGRYLEPHYVHVFRMESV